MKVLDRIHYHVLIYLISCAKFGMGVHFLSNTSHWWIQPGSMSDASDNEFWLFRLLVIIIGYYPVVTVTSLVVFFVRKYYSTTCNHPYSFWRSFLINFAIGQAEYKLDFPTVPYESHVDVKGATGSKLLYDITRILYYFSCLQMTIVSMGYLQERIMTSEYTSSFDESVTDNFKITTFIVFTNRIFALILSGCCLAVGWKREPAHSPPLFYHLFTSISNTLSSWCQYEALKYISFPIQTVCKASKIIPTMIFGFLVRGERYDKSDCAIASGLAFGAVMFAFSTKFSNPSEDQLTTISGFCLTFAYLLFDAFTLNWQKTLFDTRPRLSKYQMMFGVNSFSILLCLTVMVKENTLSPAIRFFSSYNGAIYDLCILSLCGALGQLVIYVIIEKYGPIVFAAMMTFRQIFSIILSIVSYNHPVTVWSFIGISIVFIAAFSSVHRQYFVRRNIDRLS